MSEEQQKVFLASGQVLSVSEAAKLTPYSQEYLSLLARKGRLPAVKIARDWLTTREAVLTYVEKQRSKHQDLFNRFELTNNQAGFAGLKILIMLGLAIIGVSGFLAYSVVHKSYAKNSEPGLLNFLTYFNEQKQQAENVWSGLVKDVGLLDKLARNDFGTTGIETKVGVNQGHLSPEALGKREVLAASTIAPVSLSQQIKNILYGYIQQGLFGFNASNYAPDGILHVGGINSNPSPSSVLIGGQNFTGPNGSVQNGNSQTTSVIGGTPIISYYPSAPGQNFSGGSVAGFTDLSANNFNAGNNTNLNNLNVTGNSSVNSLTVNGNTNLAGTTTIASLNIANFNPGLTLGSVLFQGPSGLTEDNSGLFYDATNHFLGIGTSTPTATLSIQGSSAGHGLVTISNTDLTGYSSIDYQNGAGVFQMGLGYGNTGTGGIFAGKSYLTTNNSPFVISVASHSTYFDTNGNVEIGTTNPSLGKFQVSNGDIIQTSQLGDTIGSFYFQARKSRGTADAPTPVIAGDNLGGLMAVPYVSNGWSGGNASIFFNAAGTPGSNYVPVNINFKTTDTTGINTQRMIIDASGNVGINTTNPLDKFEVNGNIRLTPGSNGQLIFSDGSVMSSAGLGSASSLSNPTDAVIAADSDVNGTGAIILKTGNTEKVRILNNGNIGIGTNAPTAQLTFGSNSTINSLGTLTINSALNNALSIITGTTGTLNLDSGSTGAINVGTSAFAKAITIGNGTGATSLNLNAGTGAINIGTSPNSHTVTLGNVTGTTAVNINTGTGNFALNTNQLFVNKTSGNVGVGTAAPAYKLDINGSINAGAVLVNGVPVATGGGSQWGNTGASIYYNGGNVGIGTANPAQALDVVGNINASGNINISGLLLGSGGTSGIEILANGNVGINTTTPAYPLDVNGVINATGLKINGVDVGTSADTFWNPVAGGISYGSNVQVNGSYLGTGGSLGIKIDSSGNVGIGTTSPLEKLHVQGDIQFAGTAGFLGCFGQTSSNCNIYVGNNVRDVAGSVIQSDITQPSWITRVGGGNNNSGDNFEIARIAPGSTFSSRNIILTASSSGNIGIGTAKPASKLDVYAGTDTTQILWGQNITNGGNANLPGVGYGVGLKLKMDTEPTVGSNKWVGIAGVAGMDSTKTNFPTQGWANTTDMTFYTVKDVYAGVPTEKMRLTGAGNLGIGTTTPVQALDVNGNINVSGLLLGGGGTSGIEILPSGNVGIGTLNPAYTLDVNGSINAAAVLVNGVPVGTGSGISQWGNNGSSIYYNGGNVGIGTANPAGLLDVNGNLTVLSNGNVGIGTTSPAFSLDVISNTITGGGIHLQNTNTATQNAITIENNRGGFASYGSLIYGGQTQPTSGLFGTTNRQDKLFVFADGISNLGMYLGTLKAQPLVLGTNNLERVRIDSAGNVGIGTTTPASLLSIQAVGGTPSGAIRITSGGVAGNEASIGFWDSAGKGWVTGSNLNTYFINSTTLNGHAVDILNNGNIGIGIGVPTYKLDVSGTVHAFKGTAGGLITPATTAGVVIENSDDSALQIFSPTNKSGQIMFGSSINGAQGSIIYQHSPNATSDYMSFSTLATERMRIDANGNLGLGATSPASALDIGTSGGSITFSDASSLHQLVTAGTSNLAIMPGGNVGINTINPLYKLDVNGVINASGLKINGIDVLASSTAASPWNSLGGAISYTAGNVGIGTTTPNDRLAIVSDGINPGLEVYDSSAVSQFVVNANGNIGIGTTTPNGLLDVNGKLTVLSNGNVGIGTIAPASPLDVNGDIRIHTGSGGKIVFADGSTMASANILSATTTGSSNAVSAAGDAIITGDSTAVGSGSIIFNIGSSEKMRITNAGLLTFSNGTVLGSQISWAAGLGALTHILGPSDTTFTINSAAANALNLDSGTTGGINIGTNANAKVITIGNSTGATSLILNSGTGAINIGTNAISHILTLGNSTGATSVVLNSGTGALNIGTNAIAHTVTIGNNTGASAVNINSGSGNFAVNASQLFVNDVTGNVGIGTVNPGVNLHVIGSALFSGPAHATSTAVDGELFYDSNVHSYQYFNSASGTYLSLGAGSITYNNSSTLWTALGGNNIYYNGNVGIGTTSPTEALDVNGRIIATDVGSGVRFAIGNSNGVNRIQTYSIAGPTIRFLNPANSYSAVGMGRLSVGSTYAALNSPSDGLAIEGNVGIGTIAPTAQLSFGANSTINSFGTLTVNSAAANALSVVTGTTGILTLDSGSTGAINIGASAFAKTVTIGNGTGATSLVLNAGTGAINIGTNAFAHIVTIGNVTGATAVNLNTGTGNFALNTNQLFVNKTSGNLGIGTIAPAAKQQVTTATAQDSEILSLQNTTGWTNGKFNQLTFRDITGVTGALGMTYNSGSATVDFTVNSLYNGGYKSTSTISFIVKGNGNVGIGTSTPTLGPLVMASGAYVTVGGVWTNASDRNLKENFATVTPADILQKIDKLPITEWNYKNEDPSIKHIGPVAQDFYQLFSLGGSDTSISTIDPAGVALLGIKALNEKITSLQGSLAGNATTSVLAVYNPANFSGDSVGQGEILAGATSVRVTFSQTYEYQPIVTVTPRQDIDGRYWVQDEDESGFTIMIKMSNLLSPTTNLEFNWHSFASPQAQLTVSNGTTSPITLVVAGQQPRPPQAVVVVNINQSTSGNNGQVLGNSTTTQTSIASTTPDALSTTTPAFKSPPAPAPSPSTTPISLPTTPAPAKSSPPATPAAPSANQSGPPPVAPTATASPASTPASIPQPTLPIPPPTSPAPSTGAPADPKSTKS